MAAAAAVGAIARLAGGNVGAIEKTAGAIDKLAGAGRAAFGSVTALASSITGGLLSPLGAVRDLFNSIGNLVGLFNPGVVAQFQLALNDTMAVIGSSLVPVMQGMTQYVRLFGDALAGLLPVIRPLMDSIGGYIARGAQGFLPLLQAAAPFIELFADSMALLLDKLSVGVAFLQGVVAELITTIAELFGLESRFNANASSKGFAVRQTKVGSVEQFAADLFASNLKNINARPGEARKDPADLLGEIKEAMKNGRKVVEDIRRDVAALLEVFSTKDGRERAIKKLEEGATNPGAEGFWKHFNRFMNQRAKKPW